jgi:hypothetical protein
VEGTGDVARSRCWDTRRRKGETTGNPNFDPNRRASPRPYLGEPEGEVPSGDSTDDQPSALLPGLILQAMGFMMVALRQHLPRPFNSAMEVHCANYFQMVLLRRVFSSSLAQPTFPICPNKKPAFSSMYGRAGIELLRARMIPLS